MGYFKTHENPMGYFKTPENPMGKNKTQRNPAKPKITHENPSLYSNSNRISNNNNRYYLSFNHIRKFDIIFHRERVRARERERTSRGA